MPEYEVVLRRLEPQMVVGVRGRIPSYPEQGPLWAALGEQVAKQRIAPSGAYFTMYYAEEPEIDAEVCVPVTNRYAVVEPVKHHALPAVDPAACILHRGPFATIGKAYVFLGQWMDANGYESAGPTREVYLRPARRVGSDADQNDTETVTEIQFPVRKKR